MTDKLRSMVFCGVLSANGCTWLSLRAADPPAALQDPPPRPKEERAAKLDRGQVWVAGYYEPMEGAWIWHSGRAVEKPEGYTLVEARYTEVNGEYQVSPPHWQKEELSKDK